MLLEKFIQIDFSAVKMRFGFVNDFVVYLFYSVKMLENLFSYTSKCRKIQCASELNNAAL